MGDAGLAPQVVDTLFDLAVSSIRAGLEGRRPTRDGDDDGPRLGKSAGVFVTLHVAGELHGCIGSLTAEDLGRAVPRHAWSAAFRDPRFPPLRPDQLDGLDIEISVLSPLAPLAVDSWEALIDALRPGVDGLSIEGAGRRAVFLPVVWKQLPDAVDFVDHLYRKAGLPTRSWPADMRTWTFTATEYGRVVSPRSR
ncbi:MAG: AmmeMemoRadiSam system protein A [Ilumatobacter sp.]|uniref:AmmeMemoRadiSam system protein A n=1 Tax=Ilumatobacter sp. TaxID=1967498 RepID=UPI00260D8AE3|nr:AmmeMemoRadiSam system protein A [Ilumatobacter sp.]MDJ0769280.1 AmmeMemoRadiSam system protein A [Ilumatobacter sp.]